MTATAALAAVLVVGLITYLARAGLILFLADRPLPPNIARALQYVGPAVLSALVVSFIAGGEGASGIDVEEFVALAVAAGVAARVKNLLLALTAGMVTLWVVAALV